MSAIKYRPEIDGLRGVAILGVLLFHIGSAWIPGGFTGVDVFFVISGYLITLIIYEETTQGKFSFSHFYLRRLRRLFPALAVMLLVVLLVGATTDPLGFGPIRRAVAWVLLLSGNIYIWKTTGDYWAQAAGETPLLHTWSLGIEEQFYLLFPITLVVLLRWRRGLVMPAMVGLTTLSFACCWLGTALHPAAAFYLPITRAWELLVGCILALRAPAMTEKKTSHRCAGAIAGVGVVMILVAYLALDGRTGFPGYKAALPTLGAALVIGYASGEAGIVGWSLRRPWLVFVGKISYSLYLWHWPVIVFLKAMQDSPTFRFSAPAGLFGVATAALSFGLAAVSFWVVERPLRIWRPTPWACGAAFGALLIGSALIQAQLVSKIHRSRGLTAGFAPLEVRGRLYSVNQNNELSVAVREKYKHVNFLLPEKPAPIAQGVIRSYGARGMDVAVMGDSHSLMFAPLIDDILRSNHLNGCFFCADGTAPDLYKDKYDPSAGFGTAAQCKEYDEARRDFLDAQRPKVVVWIQRYDERKFHDLRPSIQYIVDRSVCLFLQQVPVLNIGDRSAIDVFGYFKNVAGRRLDDLNIVEKPLIRAQREEFEHDLLTAFKGSDRLQWFETSKELVAANGRIRWWNGLDRIYYLDDDHLSEYGVQLFRTRLERAIVSLTAAEGTASGRDGEIH
jgi:peptidoglycan/LPS O-acetylase OafA/YrhL